MAKNNRINKKHMGNKRKPKPVTLAECPWDTGPNTAAQRAGKVLEDATYTNEDTGEKVNPNNVRRARRIDVAESLRNRGKISDGGFKAASKLREVWEGTMRRPPAIKAVQVDSSPKPDQAIAMQIDRQSRFHAVARLVPQDDWPLIEHVVLANRSLTSLGYRNARFTMGCHRLSGALDSLADKLGL